MGCLNQNKTMALTPVSPDGTDVTKIIEMAVGVVGALGGYWAYLEHRFKQAKLDVETAKLDKEEFINKVVNTSINAALFRFNTDFDKFKTETSAAMKEFNATVLKIYSEVKK